MKLPSREPLRIAAVLLLVGALVTVSLVPSFTRNVSGAPEEPMEGTSTFSAPSVEEAASLRGATADASTELALQAAKRGMDVRTPPVPEARGQDPLPPALDALAQATGTPADTPEWQATRSDAAALPPGLQRPLAVLVLASANAHQLQREALADLSAEEVQALAQGELAVEDVQSRVDMRKSLQAALLMDAAVKQTRGDLARWGVLLDAAQPTRLGLQQGESLFNRQLDPVHLTEVVKGSTSPQGILQGVARLQGGSAAAVEMPRELQEASLPELLEGTYGTMGLPLDLETRAALQASSALDPNARASLADNLRHLLHATILREQAFQELTPGERALVMGKVPLPVDRSDGVNASERQVLAAYQGAVAKVNTTALTQAGLELLQGALPGATAQTQASPAPAAGPNVTAQPCSQPDGVPPVGVAPVDVGRPVSCEVGGVRVTVEVTEDDRYHLQVDAVGDGRPEIDTTTQNVVRVHLDPGTYALTVWEDTNRDGIMQEEEKEFHMDGIRDAANNVAFVDPFGFIIVGGVDDGTTVYDGRYGRDRYPDVRDARVESTRRTVDDNTESDTPLLSGFLGDQGVTSRVSQSFWEDLKEPDQVFINPNGTQLLTVDLGGDSVYRSNSGGNFPLVAHINASYEVASILFQPFTDPGNNFCAGNYRVHPASYDVGSEVELLVSQCSAHYVEANITNRLPTLAIDRGGQDRYEPRDGLNFTMGAARIGNLATLVDQGPEDDTYRSRNTWSMGSGEPLSVALALDLGGDDTVDVGDRSLGSNGPHNLRSQVSYLLFSESFISDEEQRSKHVWGPAVSVYYDAWGNDTVSSSNHTQAYGGNPGSVALYIDDGPGDDTYTLRDDEPYGQGVAYAGATAVFLAKQGNDTYNVPDVPSADKLEKEDGPRITFQGADVSRIEDKRGDHDYDESLPGVAVLVDLAGNDTGIRHTTTIEHPPTGTYRVGWQYPMPQHVEDTEHPATAFALDADLHDPTQPRGGFLLDTGQVRVDEGRDPVAGTSYVLTVPSLLGVGDTTDTSWGDSYIVSVDLGGDDTYTNRPGSAMLLPPVYEGVNTEGSFPNVASQFRGDGALTGHDDWRPKLTSLHVDVQGSDTYRGEGNLTTQPQNWTLGFGLLAAGGFYELGGNDRYHMDGRGLGSGTLGVGVFQDVSGNDVYEASEASGGTRGLGYGSLGGYGVFLDARGADRYVAGNWSLGSYEFYLRQPLTGWQNANVTLDNRNAETGAGIFLDREGFDTYHVPVKSLGYVEDEAYHAAQNRDTRGLAAVFVDDGFGQDAYPLAHREQGHENNAYWTVNNTLARGVDNVDFLLHSSLIQQGGEPFKRIVSFLLSPSVELSGPAYGTGDITGDRPVYLNVSYGGNRTVLLNARSLAISPLHADLTTPRTENLPGGQVIGDIQEDVEENVSNLVGSINPGGKSPNQLGHLGVSYLNYTYFSLFNLFISGHYNEDRDPEREGGFTEDWHDANRDLARFLAGDVGETGYNLANDKAIRTAMGWFYGFWNEDQAGYNRVSNPTREVLVNVSDYAKGHPYHPFPNFDVGGVKGVPHPCSTEGTPCVTIYDVFDTGHTAVDSTVPGSSAAAGPPTAQEARQARATGDLLLLLKALAPTLDQGSHLEAAADEALASYGRFRGESQAAPASPAGSGAAPAGTPGSSGASTEACLDLGSEYSRKARLECHVRAAFDAAVDGNLTEDGVPLDPLNEPQNPEFVRKVELHVDGRKVAEAMGRPTTTSYKLTWTSDALDQNGTYLFPDTREDGTVGPHRVVAKAFYRPADPRPTNPTGDESTEQRAADPYGFYPGTDIVRVTTDHLPRLEENLTTDFNPEKACTPSLNCKLEFHANVSEPVDLTFQALRPDGTLVRDLGTADGSQSDGGFDVSSTNLWDANLTNSRFAPDGRYLLKVNVTERMGEGDSTETLVPFYIERDDPVTRADPTQTDGGRTGLQHLAIRTLPNGTVDQSRADAYVLNVTAALQQQVHSPISHHDLWVRVYSGTGTFQEDLTRRLCESNDAGHLLFEPPGSNAEWCRVATDAPGDTTKINLTYAEDGGYRALDGKHIYFMTNATDRAGNQEQVTFPDLSGTMRSSDRPEAVTYVDVTRPVTTLDLESPRAHDRTVTMGYTVDDSGGSGRGNLLVDWDLRTASERASGAPVEWTPLPSDLVTRTGLNTGNLTWTPDHAGVNTTVSDGDKLLIRVRAVDKAGNIEQRTQASRTITFDFHVPALAAAPNVTREPHALTLNFTTTEPVAHVNASLWPAGTNRSHAVDVNATSFEDGIVHLVRAPGLDAQTRYRVALLLEDVAGNTHEVLLNASTSNVLDITPFTPTSEDVLTGTTEATWRTTNVTGDLMVTYNLTLSADGTGNCTVPVDTARYFEGTPARRSLEFDSTELPSTDQAVFCLAANNTLNPEDPIVVRLPAEGTFTIDNEAPTTNLTARGDELRGWFAGPATVELQVQDLTPAGVTTHVAVDGEASHPYNGSFVLRQDGVHEVTFWSEDRLGHTEDRNVEEVRVDRSSPRGNLSLADGDTRTSSRNITLRLNLTDDVSGIHRVVIGATGSAPRTLPGSVFRGGAVEIPWTLSAGDGPKQVVATVEDMAGNRITVRQTLHLDTHPPEVRGLSVKEAGYTQAAVRWSSSEPSTATVLYKKAGSPAFQGQVEVESLGVNHVAVLEDLTPGTEYEVRVLARDGLGNVGPATTELTTRTDDTPPGSIQALQAQVLPSGYVKLTWDAAFDQVGVDRYVVTRTASSGATTTVGTTPDTVFLDDSVAPGSRVSYRVHAVDLAGNEGPASRSVEAHATTAPRILAANVTPDRGAQGDTFTYRLVVQDRDGDEPAFVRVVVDGESYTMRAVDPSDDIRHGAAYEYTTTLNTTKLSSGMHTYRFVVSDGPHTVSSHPRDDPATGPMVLKGSEGGSTGLAASVQRLVPGPGPGLLVLAGVAAALLAHRTRRFQL